MIISAYWDVACALMQFVRAADYTNGISSTEAFAYASRAGGV
jgi:hypothetical protein